MNGEVRRVKRRLVILVLLVVLTVAAAGCTETKKTDEAAADGGKVTLGLVGAPTGRIHPLLGGNEADRQVAELVYNGLMRFGPGLRPVCDLCESYAVSPDNRTLTFTLRRNVTWHDGKPFTAADVVATYRLALQNGRYSHSLSSLSGVQQLLDERDRVARLQAAGQLNGVGARERLQKAWETWLKGPGTEAVAAPDAFTVTFTQAVPYAPLLTELTLPILPAHDTGSQTPPPGTGPYKLTEVAKDGVVHLKRHTVYHLGKPHILAVDLVPVKLEQAGALVQEGRLDGAPVDAAGAGALKGVKEVAVTSWPVMGYQYLGVDHDSPLFADKRVRQALLFGLDRERMVREALGGLGVVVNSPIHPQLWAHLTEGLEPYLYSPQRATALLAEAGWSRPKEDGPLVKEGKPFAFTLKVPEGNQAREVTARRIQEDLKALGIKVTVERMPFAQVVREVFGERNADAWLLGWDLAADPEPGPALRPDNKWGRAPGWANAHSETLLRQGRFLMDPAQREVFYKEWERLVNDELPYLYLYAENAVMAVRTDRVRGLQPDIRGLFWNIQDWRVAR